MAQNSDPVLWQHLMKFTNSLWSKIVSTYSSRPYLHFTGRTVSEESSTQLVVTCEEFDLATMTEFGIWFGEIKMEQDAVATPVIFAFTLNHNGVPMQLLTSAAFIYQFHVFRLYVEESEAYGNWVEFIQDYADVATVSVLSQTLSTLVETVNSLERRVTILEGNGITIKNLATENTYFYNRSSSDDIMVYRDPENDFYNYVRAWKNESATETLLYSLSETPADNANLYTESQMLSISATSSWRTEIEELEVFFRVESGIE